MAFFSDPDGNSLILHHRYAPYRDGTHALMQIERVDFVSVPTRDTARAVAFYRDVLGLPDPNNPEEVDPERDARVLGARERRPSSSRTPRARPPRRRRGGGGRGARGHGVEVIGIDDSGVCHMGFCRIPTATC